jgi:hypothetical protein
MEENERKLLRTAFTSVFADLRQLRMQTDAAIKLLQEARPDLYAQYQQTLHHERATTTNEHATLLEYLDKTLLKNTVQ